MGMGDKPHAWSGAMAFLRVFLKPSCSSCAYTLLVQLATTHHTAPKDSVQPAPANGGAGCSHPLCSGDAAVHHVCAGLCNTQLHT